jgi:environmental stress-induced protein Ves
MQRINVREITPKPWKNGAGVTREIAVGPARSNENAAGDFDWRISVAEVECDAPFSAFPGIDRCIVLLRGAGMLLKARDGSIEHRLDRACEPFRFAGEAALDATLFNGPCGDFNVMTKRGEFRCEIGVHHSDAQVTGGDITMLLCVDGEWLVESDHSNDRNVLTPMLALLSREPLQRIKLRPSTPNPKAALLTVRLCHDRPR